MATDACATFARKGTSIATHKPELVHEIALSDAGFSSPGPLRYFFTAVRQMAQALVYPDYVILISAPRPTLEALP